jgi:hypothetical protein
VPDGTVGLRAGVVVAFGVGWGAVPVGIVARPAGAVAAKCPPAGAGEAFLCGPPVEGCRTGAGVTEKAGGLGPEPDTLWWPGLPAVSARAIVVASTATTTPAATVAWTCRDVRHGAWWTAPFSP